MLWDQVKTILRRTLPETTHHLWIDQLRCVRTDKGRLELVCLDLFTCSWITEHYLPAIREALAELNYSSTEVTVAVASAEDSAQEPAQAMETRQQLYLPTMPPVRSFVRALHPQYTFDQFVVGDSNALAYSACDAIARGGEDFGTHLYLESGTGLGKSHLAHAVSHHLLNNSPGTRLHYLSANQFTSEVVNGIKNNTMDQFKDKYRNHCDVLVLEGVHALAGKEKTQLELVDALDVLMEKGKRIIFTGAMAPRDIERLSDGFRSRLCAGLITSINPPDLATRWLIVKRKGKNYHMDLPEDVISYIAENIRGDIRQVESAVIGLRARSSLLNRPPDLAMASELVQRFVNEVANITVESIRDFICRQYKVSVHDLQSKARTKNIVFPRQMAMYMARKLTDEGLSVIGKAFNRDHSTVVHSIRVVTELIARDGCVRGQADLLEERLKNQIK